MTVYTFLCFFSLLQNQALIMGHSTITIEIKVTKSRIAIILSIRRSGIAIKSKPLKSQKFFRQCLPITITFCKNSLHPDVYPSLVPLWYLHLLCNLHKTKKKRREQHYKIIKNSLQSYDPWSSWTLKLIWNYWNTKFIKISVSSRSLPVEETHQIQDADENIKVWVTTGCYTDLVCFWWNARNLILGGL